MKKTFRQKKLVAYSRKPVRRTRSDSSQKPIIEAIEKAGWQVWIIGWPCDLLCWKPSKGWRTLEAKSKRKKDGTIALRSDQQAQQDFCSLTNTPYAVTPQEAIEALE